MSRSALVLTYHAIAPGPPPLNVDPDLLRRHLECLNEAGAQTLTVSELAEGLRSGRLPERAVAVTFDDAFASVADHALPMLAGEGRRATVYAVAGALGATNRWPTQPRGVAAARLAGVDELRTMVAAGWEIGSHGFEHAPLTNASEAVTRREVLDSRHALEQALQVPVTSFALPYGAPPGARADAMLRAAYAAVCTTRLAAVRRSADPFALPRVDVHYVRRLVLLRRAIAGSASAYLGIRGLAATARRVVHRDYVEVPR
jgi:peptidoglycan/xylan/chitin deacetylase (PgdA/CDA1 family)